MRSNRYATHMTTWRYTDIGRDTDPLIINSITATPDAPQPGSPWKLAINATVLETIKEGAYLDVTVKLGLINLLQKRYDLFECLNGKHPEIPLTLDDKQVGPIEKGKVDMTLALNLKREVPPAKFKILVGGYSAEEGDLFSIDATVDFTTT